MDKKNNSESGKQAITTAFYEIIKEEGLEAASLERVASKLGISPNTLSVHFGTRDELLVALVDSLIKRYEEVYLRKLASTKDAEERMEFILDAIFGVDWLEIADPLVFYACFYLSFRNEQVKRHFQGMYEWFRDILVNEVEIWQEEGLINKDLNPVQVADFIITLNEGTTYYNNIIKDKEEYMRRNKFLKIMVKNLLENNKIKNYI